MAAPGTTRPATPTDPVAAGWAATLRATRAQETATTVKFLSINGAIAVVGYLLLRALVARGVLATEANAIQAVVTLQANFLAGLLFTWRWRIASTWAGVWRRWFSFHMGRGTVLALNLALFPLLAPLLGISGAFVLLLGLCAVANYALDRWVVFRLDAGRVIV